MDLSALIFVALAVAWAVYLIPKALRHHDDSTAARTVDGFSDRLRVLARREPVDRKTARLVVPSAPRATVTPPVVPVADRRRAAARAARRRLRVVLTILLGGVVVGVLAALGYVAWPYLGVPGGVLAAWLVACRLMVRRERAVAAPTRRLPIAPEEPEVPDVEGPLTEEVAAVVLDEDPEAVDAVTTEDAPDPGGWDPVPVTLPTYVDKAPAARRSVRTIDLDSTGVWTSGRSESDSALAREAEEAERHARAITRSVEDERRASGT